MNVTLVMFKEDGTRRDFPILKKRLVVGRKSSCGLRIPLSAISRHHCEVSLTDDGIVLKDLGSSNGTYHNSIRVQEAELAAGDEVMVGPVVFTVVVDGKPATVAPVRTILDPEKAAEAYAPPEPETKEAVEIADLDLGDDDDLSRELEDELASNDQLATPSIDEEPAVGLEDSDLDLDLTFDPNEDLDMEVVSPTDPAPASSTDEPAVTEPSSTKDKASSPAPDDGDDDELDLDALFGKDAKSKTGGGESSSILEFDFDELDEI